MPTLKPRIHRPLVLLALAGICITGCRAPAADTTNVAYPSHAHAQASPGASAFADAYGSPGSLATPEPTIAPDATPEPAPTTAPALQPEIGALHLIAMDGEAPGETVRVRAGTTVQLYVGQIHNAQHVTFVIRRGDNAQPDVLDYADVIVPGLSTDGGASIFWRAEAGYPTVYLSAEAHDDAGAVTATRAYPLTIDP